MSNKDLDRLVILKKVQEKELSQLAASRILQVGDRQIRKILKRLKEEGPKGIVSKLVGRRGNRSKPIIFKQKVLALLKEKYEGFGPTLAAEKLLEFESLKVSNETIRQWMIESHLWIPRQKRTKHHLPRSRRSCFGELIQCDGSPLHWFGEDEPEANVTVFVDDATSSITCLFFSPTETLEAYFNTLKQHLKKHGRPRGLYTDKHTVFKSPNGTGQTQMQIALKELDIELILANSPQAKGRVERSNRILQDRLTKEMRLRGIRTIDQANEYAAEFVEMYNLKFSKQPKSEFDAHRSLEGYDLKRILCRKEERTLNLSGIFQFNKIHYQLQGVSEHYRNGKKIEIRVNGENMRCFLGSQEVEVLPLAEIMDQPKELNRKELIGWEARDRKQKLIHPWKVALHRETVKNRMVMI